MKLTVKNGLSERGAVFLSLAVLAVLLAAAGGAVSYSSGYPAGMSAVLGGLAFIVPQAVFALICVRSDDAVLGTGRLLMGYLVRVILIIVLSVAVYRLSYAVPAAVLVSFTAGIVCYVLLLAIISHMCRRR